MGDEDDMSLRQHLVDEFGDAVLQDDVQSVMETNEDDDLTSDAHDDEGPIDFSMPDNTHVVSSSSSSSSSDEDDEESDDEGRGETNPLRRIIQKNETQPKFPTVDVSEVRILPPLKIVAESEDRKSFKVEVATPRGVVKIPMRVSLFTPKQDGNYIVLKADAAEVLQ
jgi:hypothetical protein